MNRIQLRTQHALGLEPDAAGRLVATTANSTKGFQSIWNELPVVVTFESNWRKAKQILSEIAARHAEHLGEDAERRVQEAARKYLIRDSRLTPTVYTSVADSGVVLTIRYLTEPRRRRSSAAAIWEEVLDGFSRCDDVDFAYPTQRFFDNAGEGRPEARAGMPREGRTK